MPVYHCPRERQRCLAHIESSVMEATTVIDHIDQSRRFPNCNTADASNTLFFHWEYHPNRISQQSIRDSYNKHFADVSGFDQMIVTFSRPRNIQDSIMRMRLLDVEGSHASDIYNNLLCTGAIRRNLLKV